MRVNSQGIHDRQSQLQKQPLKHKHKIDRHIKKAISTKSIVIGCLSCNIVLLAFHLIKEAYNNPTKPIASLVKPDSTEPLVDIINTVKKISKDYLLPIVLFPTILCGFIKFLPRGKTASTTSSTSTAAPTTGVTPTAASTDLTALTALTTTTPHDIIRFQLSSSTFGYSTSECNSLILQNFNSSDRVLLTLANNRDEDLHQSLKTNLKDFSLFDRYEILHPSLKTNIKDFSLYDRYDNLHQSLKTKIKEFSEFEKIRNSLISSQIAQNRISKDQPISLELPEDMSKGMVIDFLNKLYKHKFPFKESTIIEIANSFKKRAGNNASAIQSVYRFDFQRFWSSSTTHALTKTGRRDWDLISTQGLCHENQLELSVPYRLNFDDDSENNYEISISTKGEYRVFALVKTLASIYLFDPRKGLIKNLSSNPKKMIEDYFTKFYPTKESHEIDVRLIRPIQ